MKSIRKNIFLFALSLYLFASNTLADNEAQWLWGEGQVSMEKLGWEKATIEALKKARKNALEKASGIEIRASELSLRMERHDMQGVMDIFASMIRTQINGKIVAQADTSFEFISNAGSPPVCLARGRFQVVSEVIDPDPEFGLRLTLNGRTDDINLRDGEELILAVNATKDCYLTIFNIFSNDSISVIFPNYYLQDNFIEANKNYSIFPDNLRPGITLRVNLLPEKQYDSEVVLAVATKKKYPSPFNFTANEPFGGIQHYSDALFIINKWLLEIPRDERTETVEIYGIFK